jgi:hypothetical protein
MMVTNELMSNEIPPVPLNNGAVLLVGRLLKCRLGFGREKQAYKIK